MLYQFAVQSGLRANEIRTLKRSNFKLEGAEPTVTIEAVHAKNRRRVVHPIGVDLAAALLGYLAKKLPAAKAFNMPESSLVAPMWRMDLEAARTEWLSEAADAKERADREESGFLVYVSQDGRVADFHALRHTYISNLAKAGVHPKTAQMLARHSSITMTMDRYTHSYVGDERAALDKLPKIDVAADEDSAATDPGA